MIHRLKAYARFVKIEHSVFALPLVLAGVVLGKGETSPSLLSESAFILAAAVGGRVVAFALNRIIDSQIDALNPRTSQRELPSGKVNYREAVAIGGCGALIYFVAAYELMGAAGIFLGFVPLAVFTIYPFMKRFTSLAHFGVGLSLALAPLAGWLAIISVYHRSMGSLSQVIGGTTSFVLMSESFLKIPWLVIFTFFWVSGFDIIYSTMDEEFDRRHGLHSLPATFGHRKALWVSAGLHLLAFVSLSILFVSYFRTPVAGVLLGATGVLLFLEQYLAENVELAFFKINGVIGFLILAFVWTGVSHL